ncbi:hypothetical protein H2199_002745 [Coniosporium tulheliwenetii]|uniref:Uncharacterized protein n=1 Tax=Coniosporium tulheliwenetii TaxID=3383036 RepID=A0ACC2ZDM6_9PEZI|nr:hypothetical protein H2199_002745 [Cladosporium sp. JES 115]
MPRNKLVYGKRPKNSSTFASSASFAWSSPQKPATTIHPDKAVEVGVTEVTEALEALQVRDNHKTASKNGSKDGTGDVKQKTEALQTKDVNAILKPVLRHKDGKDRRASRGMPPADTARDSKESDCHPTSGDASKESQEARTTPSAKEKETTKRKGHRSESTRAHKSEPKPPTPNQMPDCLPIRIRAPPPR